MVEYLVLDFFGTIVSLGSLLDSYKELGRRLQPRAEGDWSPDEFARLYARVLDEYWSRGRTSFTHALVEAARRVGVALDVAEASRLILDVVPQRLMVYRDAVEALTVASTFFAGVAVASDGERSVVEEAIRLKGLDAYIQVVATSDEAGRTKPDPAVIRLALERLGGDPAEAGLIGDSEKDIEAGRRAGVKFKGLVVRRPLRLSASQPDAVACDLVNLVRLASIS